MNPEEMALTVKRAQAQSALSSLANPVGTGGKSCLAAPKEIDPLAVTRAQAQSALAALSNPGQIVAKPSSSVLKKETAAAMPRAGALPAASVAAPVQSVPSGVVAARRPLPRLTSGETFDIEELPAINNVIFGNATDAQKEQQKRRFMRLPSWVDLSLDPFSQEYRAQQMRIWKLVSACTEDYDPRRSELTNPTGDGFQRPGVYGTNDAFIVGDHTIAYGHLLMRSGIRAGDHVLEYGPGFGQLALAFARTGAIVDTVEVDPGHHAIVNKLATIYGVNLRCHRELFGFIPPDRPHFDLIMFYESFHHCLEFISVVPKLKSFLSRKGKILMAGEPIVPDNSPLVPYPWGIRLDAENVCVVRQRGWMELGFQEGFIRRFFERCGFSWTKHESISHHSPVYEAIPERR